MKPRYAIILGAVMLAGCSPELSREDARNDIRERLANAGLTLGDEPWAGIDIRIEEILQPSDARRLVHFRLVSASETSDIFQIVYVRSDAGWSLTEFDSDAIDLVTNIVWAGYTAPYSDLIATLFGLDDLIFWWRNEIVNRTIDEKKKWKPMSESSIRAGQELTAVFDYYKVHGPTRTVLADLVAADTSGPLPNGVTWGVYPDEEAVLIWARYQDNPARVCVDPYDEDYDYESSSDFAWIFGDDIQCYGESGRFRFDMLAVLDGRPWLD